MKLLQHYRCHSDIIEFSNKEFYEGELIPCADPLVTHSLLGFKRLKGSSSPIIFHAITGVDEREGLSPSFFNRAEASLVKEYINELLVDRELGLGQCIIIITTIQYLRVSA